MSVPIRVLLVEDNPHDRRVFHRAFRKSDVETEIEDCKRAEEALDLLLMDPDRFDLVVSDYGLPGNSGLDLYRQMQELQIEIPFVLLTGVGNELLAVEALKLGVHEYLSKNAGQAYVEQLPTSIERVFQVHCDRVRKAQIEAEFEQRESNEQFLSEATTAVLLAAIDDVDTTTARVADMALPFFADWCVVDIPERNGLPRQVSTAHSDSQWQPFMDRLADALRKQTITSEIAVEVMQDVRARLITEIENPADLISPAVSGLIGALNPKSAICTPLAVQDRVLGVMWLIYADSDRRYRQQTLGFAERLGQRAAIAIENARVYASVRATDRRKDEFLAMLAHELRNPLAPVRNALELLRNAQNDPQLIQKTVDTMERQVEHMIRLVDDLLDLSRVMRGKITLCREPVALEDIVARGLELAQPLIEARKHELMVQVPREPVWLDADGARITQVLANLLNNAAKYTDQGGHIWLDAERSGGELLIHVRDDGIGIDGPQLAQVFGLFQQVESSLNRSHGGLGIGLTLVRSLTEMHGGSVSAYSDGLGTGSEFVVRLPVLELSANGPKTQRADDQQSGARASRQRILVVDDNVDAAEMISTLLRNDGHQVRMANDGLTALDMAADFQPNVVLLDIGMPEMNGYEVVRRFRLCEDFQQTQIIAVTGFGQAKDHQLTRDAGFDNHLVKPVSLQAIREAIIQQPACDSALD